MRSKELKLKTKSYISTVYYDKNSKWVYDNTKKIVHPFGTQDYPVNSLEDAKKIQKELNLDKIVELNKNNNKMVKNKKYIYLYETLEHGSYHAFSSLKKAQDYLMKYENWFITKEDVYILNELNFIGIDGTYLKKIELK